MPFAACEGVGIDRNAPEKRARRTILIMSMDCENKRQQNGKDCELASKTANHAEISLHLAILAFMLNVAGSHSPAYAGRCSEACEPLTRAQCGAEFHAAVVLDITVPSRCILVPCRLMPRWTIDILMTCT